VREQVIIGVEIPYSSNLICDPPLTLNTEKNMKKIFYALSVFLLTAGSAQAGLVANLDLLPNAGNFANGAVISTSQALNGATFDITYTLSSIGNGGVSSLQQDGNGKLGVRSVADGTTSGHYTTLEGNDNEGLSFTGLSITNFIAGTSDYELSDFRDLTFTQLTVTDAGNARDGIDLSFTSFVDASPANINLDPGGPVQALDLTALGNFGGLETNLFIDPDGNFGSNRWAVIGIQASFNAVPEPTTFAMLGLGVMATLVPRRRRR